MQKGIRLIEMNMSAALLTLVVAFSLGLLIMLFISNKFRSRYKVLYGEGVDISLRFG